MRSRKTHLRDYDRAHLKGFKYLVLKAYFDKGLGLTNYVKYLIAFFGIASLDVKSTMYIGIAYLFFCYFLGRWWYKHKLIETENEINNIFNPFMKEVRQKLISKA